MVRGTRGGGQAASEPSPCPWQIRRAFRSIRNTLPEITYVFLLFMFSLLMFSLMALKLFGERCGYFLCSWADSKQFLGNASTADRHSSCCCDPSA